MTDKKFKYIVLLSLHFIVTSMVLRWSLRNPVRLLKMLDDGVTETYTKKNTGE